VSTTPVTINAGKAISEPAVFVTGTDTGVGKTVVSAVLATAAASRGAEAGYLKPVQTGVLDSVDRERGHHPLEGLEPFYSDISDARFVEAVASSRGLHVETRTTFSFPLPAAPPVAADHAGREVDVSKIITDFEDLQGICDFVVVEGAGGILVPLAPGLSMADFANELGLGCVVVCTLSLGTLNHTMLTVEAAHSRGLSVVGLAIARVPDQLSIVEEKNFALLPEITGLEIVLAIPEDSSLDVGRASPGALADIAAQVPKGFSSPKKI
jgi:dethiobiotin synthetase